ncbi:hypothetical protein RJ639_036214, partial [Escallonia herrerae]
SLNCLKAIIPLTSILSSAKTPITGGRDEVYVAAVALRATKRPGQLLMSTAYALNLWDMQHFMVIINPSSPPHSQKIESKLLLRNGFKTQFQHFQPQDPESISVDCSTCSSIRQEGTSRVAVKNIALLSETSFLTAERATGSILTRKPTKLPKAKCWFIKSSEVDAVDATHKFNQCWETDLRIGQHDCRDYTNGLVEYLTGEKDVLERLQGSVRW